MDLDLSRQSRDRHRRQPRHRQGDRAGARPRRRRSRNRRARPGRARRSGRRYRAEDRPRRQSDCRRHRRRRPVKAMVAAVQAAFGRIDILVNCAAQPAGQAKPPALAEITTEDLWADVNVKVMGYLRTAREVAGPMVARGAGASSTSAAWRRAATGSIIGSIRNISVAALTKNLADELGPKGITAVCVHPGLTRTEKTPGVIERRAAAQGVTAAEIEKQMDALNLVGKLITAEEIAYLVAFLASPKSQRHQWRRDRRRRRDTRGDPLLKPGCPLRGETFTPTEALRRFPRWSARARCAARFSRWRICAGLRRCCSPRLRRRRPHNYAATPRAPSNSTPKFVATPARTIVWMPRRRIGDRARFHKKRPNAFS